MSALAPFIVCAALELVLAVPLASANLLVVGTVLLLEYVVLMFAIRNAGTRLVANVLAVEAALLGRQ